jgi:hypothetical protein
VSPGAPQAVAGLDEKLTSEAAAYNPAGFANGIITVDSKINDPSMVLNKVEFSLSLMQIPFKRFNLPVEVARSLLRKNARVIGISFLLEDLFFLCVIIIRINKTFPVSAGNHCAFVPFPRKNVPSPVKNRQKRIARYPGPPGDGPGTAGPYRADAPG